MKVSFYNDQDEEEEFELPSKKEVCPRCSGNGTHLTPSIGEYAYSQEEFYESFDEEGREQYFTRGGIYDVVCYECHGKNVVDVVDDSSLNEDQKKIYERYLQRQRDQEMDDNISRSEMMFGC